MKGLMTTKVREILKDLAADELVALVRCEAGKPYAKTPVSARLRKLELIGRTGWHCTKLGREVVAAACGVELKVVRAPKKDPPAPKYTAPFKVADGKEAIPAYAQRQAICTKCTKEIPKDDPCLWIATEGVFHEDCVEKAS